MSASRDRLREDRMMRDAARALVSADIAHLKADLGHRGIGGRAADRIAAGANDVYDEALDVARDHKGALAAIVAALGLWFARNPILETLFGEGGQVEENDGIVGAYDEDDRPVRDRRAAEHYRR